MNVVTRKHLFEAEKLYPDAAKELRGWYKTVANARWRSLLDVRQVFPDADAVGGYVVFNIRQNRYRLITVLHYARQKEDRLTEGHAYIRSFLTHKQYDNRDNWDKGANR
jgi:mRNA interferase HigB